MVTPFNPEVDQTPLEAFVTILCILLTFLIGGALLIEVNTGKPAKVAIQEWWNG